MANGICSEKLKTKQNIKKPPSQITNQDQQGAHLQVMKLSIIACQSWTNIEIFRNVLKGVLKGVLKV